MPSRVILILPELSCLGTLVIALLDWSPILPCDHCSLIPSRTVAYHRVPRWLRLRNEGTRVYRVPSGPAAYHRVPAADFAHEPAR